MSLKLLKTLFESQKFQEILDHITQLEDQSEFSSLQEDVQIDCYYYKCRALEGVGQIENALQQATKAWMNIARTENPVQLLQFLFVQKSTLKRLDRLDELENLYKEGDQKLKLGTYEFINNYENCRSYWTEERLEEAHEFFKEGLKWRITREDKQGAVTSLLSLGEVHFLKSYLFKKHQKSLDQALNCFQKSLKISKEIGNKNNISEALRGLGKVYMFRKEYVIALNCFHKISPYYEEIRDKRRVEEVLKLIRMIYAIQGDVEKEIEFVKKSLVVFQEIEVKEAVAQCYLQLHSIYGWVKGESDLSLTYLKKCNDIYKKLENKKNNTMLIYWFGAHYKRIGELDRAIEYFNKGMKFAEDIKWKGAIALFFHGLGWAYAEKGELDRAIGYMHDSITLFEEVRSSSSLYGWIKWPLVNIGTAYQSKGNFEIAIKYYLKSLALTQSSPSSNILCIAANLYQFFTLAIEMNSRDQAKIFLQKLKNLHSKYPQHTYLLHKCLIMEAIILKSSTRLKDRVKAQKLLQQVVDSKIVLHWITINAHLHLLELLLSEVRWLGDQDVLEQAKRLTSKLSTLAMDQNLIELQINIIIIQIQFEIIQGNFTTALELLNSARETAKQSNFHLLVEKITEEEQQLEAELERWKNLIQRSAPLQERLEQAQLERYIEEVRKLVTNIR